MGMSWVLDIRVIVYSSSCDSMYYCIVVGTYMYVHEQCNPNVYDLASL